MQWRRFLSWCYSWWDFLWPGLWLYILATSTWKPSWSLKIHASPLYRLLFPTDLPLLALALVLWFMVSGVFTAIHTRHFGDKFVSSSSPHTIPHACMMFSLSVTLPASLCFSGFPWSPAESRFLSVRTCVIMNFTHHYACRLFFLQWEFIWQITTNQALKMLCETCNSSSTEDTICLSSATENFPWGMWAPLVMGEGGWVWREPAQGLVSAPLCPTLAPFCMVTLRSLSALSCGTLSWSCPQSWEIELVDLSPCSLLLGNYEAGVWQWLSESSMGLSIH